MYNDIKQKIYNHLISNTGNKVAILWSGGPYSSLVWFLAKKHLNLDLPIIFIDTGDLPPSLYAHIVKTQRDHGLNVEIVQGNLQKVINDQKKRYDVLFAGRPIDGAVCVVPESPDTWNFIKSLSLPMFGGVKKGILG